jgi:hypothetical protein
MVNRHKYAAKMDQKRLNRLAVGIVSDRFPEVASIVINLTYFQNGPNPILMERMVNIFPESDAYFVMGCMTKGCRNGGYDLSAVVDGMIKNRTGSKKGSLVCGGEVDAPVEKHASIEYDISVKFNKVAKPAKVS